MGWSKASIAMALALAASLAAGCGTSDPKRAVDARTEVIRFFSVDTPVVALLRPAPPARLAELDSAAAGIPAWTSLRSAILGPLHAAGLRGSELAQLARPSEEIEGVDAAAIAIGAPTPASLATGARLLVFATDQNELLARLLRRSAESGRLQPAGSLDEARLYRSSGAAFAARDGVLVSAPLLGDVEAAIERRDGDSDEQLDEDVVKALFDELSIEGPLLAYADMQAASDADPGLRDLAARLGWVGELGKVAASADPAGDAVTIEVAAEAAEGDLETSELPVGETPTRFRISISTATQLLPPAATDPARELLLGLAPLSGEATASSEEVRAQAEVSP